MPSIPVGLVPVTDGFSIGAPTGVQRVEVGGGVARYSMEWDGSRQVVQTSLVMDSEELSIWTAFYHHVVKKGSIAFDMPLDTGFGVASHNVVVVPGTLSAARQGPHTRVSFAVETVSGVYSMTRAEAIALVDAYNGYAPGAVPAIPRGLRPMVSAYSYTGPDGTFRSEVAGGNPAVALEWDRAAQMFSVTLLLTAEKFAAWTAFFHHVAMKGAVAFEMPLDSGLGVQTHLVNVVPGSYRATRKAALTTVAFDVEAESTAYAMSGTEAAAMVDLYNAYGHGLSALLARIATFANEDTLVLP